MVRIIIAQPERIFAYLPMYISIEEYGFKLLNTGNDDSAIRAVVEGRADISVGDPIMFNCVDYGKVKVIGGFINRAFNWLITFNPFLKELDNKVAVTYPSPSTTYHMAKRLQKKHKLKLIETPFNTELGPLLTQEADFGFVLDPNYTLATMNRAITLQSFLKEKIAFTGFCSLRQNQSFLAKIRKGKKILNEDKTHSLSVAKKYFPLSEEVLKKAIKNLTSVDMYNTAFTKEEIDNAFRLKNLQKQKYMRFISKDALRG